MATPSTVISLGYGSWGSLTTVILLGLGVESVAPARLVAVAVDFGYTVPQRVDFGYTVLQQVDFGYTVAQTAHF